MIVTRVVVPWGDIHIIVKTIDNQYIIMPYTKLKSGALFATHHYNYTAYTKLIVCCHHLVR